MIIATSLCFIACDATETPPTTENNTTTDDNLSSEDLFLDDDNDSEDLSTEDNQTTEDNLSTDTENVPQVDNGQDDQDEEIIQYQTLLMSTTNSLNIRSGSSTSYAVVGQIDKGDCVTFCGTAGSFYITEYKGKTAYVSMSYVQKVQFEMSDNAGIELAIAYGQALLGTPYELGAERLHWGNGVFNTNYTGTTYDCSSLVQYMYYYGMGINLDVTSRLQSVQGTMVASGDLQRGDIMFFTNSSRYYKTGIERIGHVGVYLGNNYILHTASDYAVIEEISATRWSYLIHSMRHA